MTLDVAAPHRWQDWTLEQLLAAKQRAGHRVSLVVPARNEAATVGAVISRVRERLLETVSLLDEIVVIDSDSSDDTFDVAEQAGAKVYRAAQIRPDLGWHPGKGEAMWKSQFVTTGDVVVFMDADLTDWDTHFIPGLLGPLLSDSRVQLVKGCYRRPLQLGDGEPGRALIDADWEGGRVTELVARPLLTLLFSELTSVVQPLAGEWAIRRQALAQLEVPHGYAVEIAALIDISRRYGVEGIAQVDLGVRAHRHQALRDLGAMAVQVMAATLARADCGSIPAESMILLRQFNSGLPVLSGSEPAPAPPRLLDVGSRPAFTTIKEQP